jgi:hypothetical protein
LRARRVVVVVVVSKATPGSRLRTRRVGGG